MKISIICPVYNSEKYLEQTICSVLSQSTSNWELILIDDGSTDRSGTICDKYSSLDERIVVIHKNNDGQMNARIDGIKASSGDYVVFLDSDDLLRDKFTYILENQVDDFPNADAFIFNAEVFSAGKEPKNIPRINSSESIFDHKQVFEFVFGKQVFGYLWMYCIKKNCLLRVVKKNNSYLNVRYTEDMAFLYNALSEIKSITTITEKLYLYRDNESSITRNLTIIDRCDRYNVYNFIYERIFSEFNDFKLDNQLAISISWTLFSYLEHVKDKKEFKRVFKKTKKEFIFKCVCKNVKTKNRRFKCYRTLIKLGLRNLLYLITHK